MLFKQRRQPVRADNRATLPKQIMNASHRIIEVHELDGSKQFGSIQRNGNDFRNLIPEVRQEFIIRQGWNL